MSFIYGKFNSIRLDNPDPIYANDYCVYSGTDIYVFHAHYGTTAKSILVSLNPITAIPNGTWGPNMQDIVIDGVTYHASIPAFPNFDAGYVSTPYLAVNEGYDLSTSAAVNEVILLMFGGGIGQMQVPVQWTYKGKTYEASFEIEITGGGNSGEGYSDDSGGSESGGGGNFDNNDGGGSSDDSGGSQSGGGGHF